MLDWVKTVLSQAMSEDKRSTLRNQALENKYDTLTAELKAAEDELMDMETTNDGESKVAESKRNESTAGFASSDAKRSAKQQSDDPNMLPYTLVYPDHSSNNSSSQSSVMPQVTIRFAVERE